MILTWGTKGQIIRPRCIGRRDAPYPRAICLSLFTIVSMNCDRTVVTDCVRQVQFMNCDRTVVTDCVRQAQFMNCCYKVT